MTSTPTPKQPTLTLPATQKQIDVIKKEAKEATQSKESALQLLIDAGIIKGKNDSNENPLQRKNNAHLD